MREKIIMILRKIMSEKIYYDIPKDNVRKNLLRYGKFY